MEQIIAMLAKMDAKMDATLARMDATQEDINTNQAKTDINLKEMRKEIKS
jgi:hypothetical protein